MKTQESSKIKRRSSMTDALFLNFPVYMLGENGLFKASAWVRRWAERLLVGDNWQEDCVDCLCVSLLLAIAALCWVDDGSDV